MEVEYELGLLGLAKSDVALPRPGGASILGALALGDIGKLFPDRDPRCKDARRLLLDEVMRLAPGARLRAGQLRYHHCGPEAELAPLHRQYAQPYCRDLGCTVEQVSVKATTEEGLGFTGALEIAASAVLPAAPQ